MLKNKLVVVAMAGMLAMSIGLTACGGSSASNSAAASSAADASSSAAAAESAAGSAAASEAAASTTAADASSTSSNEILYWEGALSDGSTVSYLDNAFKGVAALSIANSDLTEAVVWLGSSSSDDNSKVTVTDAETGSTISYTIVDITPTLFTIDLEGYGKVELKPVTEADYKAYAEDLAEASSEAQKLLQDMYTGGKNMKKELREQANRLEEEFAALDDSTIFFWEGALSDGSAVSFMDDPESGEALLSIVEPDASDAVVWYGKCAAGQDGKTMILTDAETGYTIAYEIVEETPNTSMKMKIEAYGTVNLKPVTKGDFVELSEELQKISDAVASESAAAASESAASTDSASESAASTAK